MKKTIILSALLAMSLSACNTYIMDPVRECSRLEVNIRNNLHTKALIETVTLAEGSEVGITVLEADNSDYDGNAEFKNVKFTSSTSGGSQLWTPVKDILLSTTKGSLYAYYPYSASAQDITAIPVSATSSSQTDYMYGTPVTNLSNKNVTADVALKHALAGVRLSISKGSFSGKGQITAVSISGEAIATGATMNAMNGSLSGFTGTGTHISPDFQPFTVSQSPEVKDFIVIPTGTEKSFTIEIEVDGVKIQTQTPPIDLAEGVISEFSVTVNSKALVINGVSVTPWTNSSKGTLEIL